MHTKRSMLGMRKNIPRPTPIKPPVSVTKRGLGTGSVKRKCPQRVNLPRARCQEVWSPSEELLTRNQKTKMQDFGAKREKGGSSEYTYSKLIAARDKENICSGFRCNPLTNHTEGGMAVQCLQRTPKTSVSSNSVDTSCFGNRLPIPEAPILLQSTRSKIPASLISHSSTKSSELGKMLPAFDPAIAGTSAKRELLNSNISHRLSGFTNHPLTESSELGKIFPATGPAVVGNNEIPKFLNSIISGGALVYDYGVMKTEDAPVLTRNLLQSHESFRQPRGTNGIHHVTAETLDTESRVLKSKIPQSVKRFQNGGMKSCKEVGKVPSLSHPTTNKQCNGMSFQGSLLLRDEGSGKLDAKECEEHIANSRKSKLSPCVERPPLLLSSPKSCSFTDFTNMEVTNKPAVIPSAELDNISACCSGMTTTESSWPRVSEHVKFSGFSSSFGRTEVVTDFKRKRLADDSTDRHGCRLSKGRSNQCKKNDNCGESDEAYTKLSLLCNVTDSRLSKRSLESKDLGEWIVPNTKKLNVATECTSSWKTSADEMPIVKLPRPSEPKVSLSRKKAYSTSGDKTGSIQNISIENSAAPNSPVFLFEGSELHKSTCTVPCSTVPNQIFIAQNGGKSAISVAIQTDLIVQDTTMKTDSSFCVKSAIENLAALCKKQEEVIQAVLKQTNAISNEMVKILNHIGSEQEGKLNSDSTERKSYDSCEDSDMPSRRFMPRTPLRRSARIAAQGSGTVTPKSKSVPATRTQLESGQGVDCLNTESYSGCSTVKSSKSAAVYKELRSDFCFLKTPQVTKHSHARIPRNTPTRILSRRLHSQILSLYD